MSAPLRWNQGRAELEALIQNGRLESVAPNRALAEAMLAQALRHLRSARNLSETDPVGAFQLAYDAARKSLAAILVNQGLRATSTGGGHAVLLEAVRAQLHPPMGHDLEPFAWMRRTRNDSEYPTPDAPVASTADVDEAIPASERIVEVALAVVPTMPGF